jgi:hypothetical protein
MRQFGKVDSRSDPREIICGARASDIFAAQLMHTPGNRRRL